MADAIVERLDEAHALEVRQILRDAIALEVAEEARAAVDEADVAGRSTADGPAPASAAAP
jgi:hypothetical protein